MANIIAGLLIGGFATLVLLWSHGPFLAIVLAPVGASLLALLVAGGYWLLGHPIIAPRRPKKELSEFDRQRN